MAFQDDALTTTAFVDQNWIAASGGWLHANNVLFYFAQSPFYDSKSANQTIITQNAGIPDREALFLSTRQRFEAQLELITGIQYVVAHDPLESNVKYNGPDGPVQSDIWVIRKQYRYERANKDQNVNVLGYYYIINQIIYQSPSLAGVFSYRMLNTVLSLDKILTTAATLPVFSASHGHTYTLPAPKTATSMGAIQVQQRREGSPRAEQAISTFKSAPHAKESNLSSQSDLRILREAMGMVAQFGGEYSDDMPLVGEPGNFRYAKTKDVIIKPTSLSRQPDGTRPTPTSSLAKTEPVIRSPATNPNNS